MLDIKLLREEPEKVKEGILKKGADPKLVDDFLKLDTAWRKITAELDNLRAEQKELSGERDLESAKGLKEKIKIKKQEISELEKERLGIWIKIPNLPDDDVPVGPDESGNRVLRTWGEPTKFDFHPRDHLELGEKLGLIDVERASRIAGSRFNYLKGEAVLLEFALVKFVFDVLSDEEILKKLAGEIEKEYPSKLFLPMVPPAMIKTDVLQKMARLEPEEERYYIPSDDLYLVGSAEHALGPFHLGEIIPEDRLPIRYIGFSSSFRREAGSYGKDMRGILRMHQFDKLEMETFTLPEDSRKEQDFIVTIQEYLVQSLGLPYQVVAICTGDMGAPDTRQIDIETWLPSQNRYRETHTSDLMTDYQAHRLQTRVRRKNGEIQFVHMNDATAFAIGRTLIAIMENYQTKEGKIRVPKILQKYLGKKIIG